MAPETPCHPRKKPLTIAFNALASLGTCPSGKKAMARPRIHINCAMTADGKIAKPNGSRLRISSDEDLVRVHRMRNRCDAILVGIGTILMDDPSLLVKKRYVKRPRHPLRVVLDSRGRVPAKAKVMDDGARTLIAVTSGHVRKVKRKISAQGTEGRAFGKGKVDLKALMAHLGRKGVRSVMVEGGGEVIWAFIEAALVDELTIFVGDMVVGGKGPTPASGSGIGRRGMPVSLDLRSVKKMEGGVLLRYIPKRRRSRPKS